jgi:alcohol dehydrogenase class IV
MLMEGCISNSKTTTNQKGNTMNIQNLFEMYLRTRIFGGDGSINNLPEICKGHGSKILLVTAKELSDLMREVISCFEKSDFSIETFFLELSEPTCEFINNSTKQLSGKNYDCIIGLGGGSAIDMAKALSISLTHTEAIWMYANLSDRPALPLMNNPIPVIAIPTTAGTGSEVTPYAVLTNSETKQKGTIQEPAIFPKAAILEPRFTKCMPSELTASTGIDAFTHALESYLNVSKYSPVSEWAGRESMRLIFESLKAVYDNPDDLHLRMNMAWASTLAGVAIAHRGTTAIHAIAEPLGALTHIPHGHAVSISTLPVLKHTWKTASSKLADLYQSVFKMWSLEKTESYYAEVFVDEVQKLIESVNMNKTVSDYLPHEKVRNLETELLGNVIRYKFRPLKQHPVEFDKDKLCLIINKIIG